MIKFDKLIEAINNAAEIANATLADSTDQVIDNFFEENEEGTGKVAKTFKIEYPSTEANGKIKVVEVNVPLITVVPISSARIEEMKFSTKLDIAIENDELMVSFSKGNSPSNPDVSGRPSANLELLIKPQGNTDGLDKLIEGYEKSLRSQIPG